MIHKAFVSKITSHRLYSDNRSSKVSYVVAAVRGEWQFRGRSLRRTHSHTDNSQKFCALDHRYKKLSASRLGHTWLGNKHWYFSFFNLKVRSKKHDLCPLVSSLRRIAKPIAERLCIRVHHTNLFNVVVGDQPWSAKF